MPPYTHIPGITPHPTGDPRGHSFGREHVGCCTPNWTSLPECRPFQHGIRLFNAGYYWEAHEAWEGVWIAAGRSGLVADFVKGLIKLAAAGVKLREGELNGVRRHLGRAAELFTLTQSRLISRSEDGELPPFDLDHGVADELKTGCDFRWPLELAQRLQHQLPTVPESNAGQPVVLLGLL